MVEKTIVVNNGVGIHARPAAMLVKEAAAYKGTVKIVKGGKEYDCKSILGIMGAAVKNGEEIVLRVDGEGEQEMLDKVIAMIESGFGEKH
ncbi:MAG: HPr family phosphocarrier protein [Negativicutes bacterium]|nr:HPr family phosphocarrier protein [Negativicutes bacterium]